jgi:dTMP kinase
VSAGLFITFEGVDGAGKSTHLAWSADWFRSQGRSPLVTREPGGTPIGEKLRDLLLNGDAKLQPETEALLMFAARKEHVAQVIEPALKRGELVLCDRFTDASFAYQGGGCGVPTELLSALERSVQGRLQPDLTLYFDLPVQMAQDRIAGSRSRDRFERESAQFFENVRRAYLERARAAPWRMLVIDASRPVETIQKQLEQIYLTRWPT